MDDRALRRFLWSLSLSIGKLISKSKVMARIDSDRTRVIDNNRVVIPAALHFQRPLADLGKGRGGSCTLGVSE